MILLIPLGPEAETPRVPRLVAGLIALNTVVFFLTHRSDTWRVAQEEARLERIADWTLRKAAETKPEIDSMRGRHSTALAFLVAEDAWREGVRDAEARERLERCLLDYNQLTASHPFYVHGFVPANISIRRLVSHQFLHADFLHLLFNMIFLWSVGGLLELTWGGLVLGGVYLLSGFAAALTHASFNMMSTEPAVGASGAIAGLMGAFAVFHARERIRIAMVAMLALAPRISFLSVPAFVFLGVWFLEQTFWALMTTHVNVGVAFWAHLGGFAFGAVAAVVLKVALARSLQQR